MATMRHVAERAGVSITTVSHVINGTRVVSDELRTQVMTAIAELEYRPNTLARGLRSGKTLTIGMIVPDSANPFFAEVARGIETTTFEYGFNVILCNSDGDLERELKYADLLIEKSVDGIIFIAAGISTEQIQHLQAKKAPLVVVDREIPDVSVDMVLTDNAQGGYLATQHLINLGHRCIGCIRGLAVHTPSANRVIGYRQALKGARIQIDETLIVHGDFQFESGYQAAQQLLTSANLPTAIFACNDLMAVGAISAVHEHRLQVPEDISIVGFDNIRLAQYSNPALTTIIQPTHEIGVIASTMLLERINNPAIPIRREVLETELIVRQSTTQLRVL